MQKIREMKWKGSRCLSGLGVQGDFPESQHLGENWMGPLGLCDEPMTN